MVMSLKKSNNSEPLTFLVTGAGGCVGGALVAKLLARGARVVVTDRPGTPLPSGPPGKLTAISGDLTDPALPARLVEGVDVIVHTAAIVDIHMTMEQLRPINVDAVIALFDAAAVAGVKTFVHFGTGSIYASQGRPLAEDDPTLVQNDYGASKLLSEDLLRAREGRGPVVNILRPALVYGPRGRVLLNLFAALPPVLAELFPVAPRFAGGPRSNSVHADDVANAALFLADHPQPHGSIFNIANDDPVSAGELITITCHSYGQRVVGPPIPLPTALIQYSRPLFDHDPVFALLNGGIDLVWRHLRRKHNLSEEFTPLIPREMLDFVTADYVFDNRKLKGLGFELEHPTFAPSWKATIQWFQQNRWIP
jgi:2-alkyl-3-oxoalkanoate reductase